MDAGQADARPAPRRLRPGHLQLVLALCTAVLAGVAIGAGVHLLLHRSQPRAAGTVGATGASATTAPNATGSLQGEARWAAGVRPAPAIRGLHDQSGRLFAMSALHGHTVVIAFFDSHCNQACPLEGRALAAAEDALPAGQRPVLVVVSVNPQDTAASSRAAAHKWGLAQVGPWHWLRGTHAQLARAWRAYHIAVLPPRDGDIAHTEALYLVDHRGDERSAYLYPFAAHFVTHDLRTLSRGNSA